MCNRKINKNLTLDYNICNRGIEKAKAMGLNFSAYVTLLIYNDINKINIVEEKNAIKTEEKPKIEEFEVNVFDNGLTNNENEKFIDNLLGGINIE